MVITHRPEYDSPWKSHTHQVSIPLSRLNRNQAVEIVQDIGGRDLSSDMVERIVARSDGVPLYLEELAKSVAESGATADDQNLKDLIPESLQASLITRLDRLGDAKIIAQVGAVIGRDFTYALIASASETAEGELDNALDQIIASELMFCRGTPPDAIYTFKHALVQDAAYQSLLKSTRQQYHGRIARSLEEHFPDTVEAEPQLLAHHYTEAGFAEQALGYWLRAGGRAVERSANIEAIAQLEKGLDLLISVAPSHQRQSDELAAQIALGVARMAIKGFGDSEVERAYTRAVELAEQLGETSHLFTAKWGLWLFNQTLLHFQSAQDISEELLELARRRDDTGHLLQAHHAAWTTRFSRGELQSAMEHIDQGRRIYDQRQHGDHAYIYGGHDPGVCCHVVGAWALWLLGHPDRARDTVDEARHIANDLSHPFSQAQAHAWAAIVHQLRRDVAPTLEWAVETTALSDEHGFDTSIWTMMASATRGWVLVRQGDVEEGVATIRRGLEMCKTPFYRSYVLTILVEAETEAGRFDEALAVLSEAREMTEKMEERWWQPEVLRLTGEFLFMRSPDKVSAAAEQFDLALAVARQTGARSLELRAATSLARLLSSQGKVTEARETLAPVYGWFTEGFDTPDLKDAKALLDELG